MSDYLRDQRECDVYILNLETGVTDPNNTWLWRDVTGNVLHTLGEFPLRDTQDVSLSCKHGKRQKWCVRNERLTDKYDGCSRCFLWVSLSWFTSQNSPCLSHTGPLSCPKFIHWKKQKQNNSFNQVFHDWLPLTNRRFGHGQQKGAGLLYSKAELFFLDYKRQ